MNITQTEIDDMRRLHEAATQGEWRYDDGVTDGEGTADAERGKPAWITTKGNMLIAEPSGSYWQEACVPTLAEMDANGRLIVATRNALPALLDAAEERDAFAKWIAMQLETGPGPDWACAQCVPRSYGNDMVVEGFVCIRHRANAIVAAKVQP